jgi:hypothetical protein
MVLKRNPRFLLILLLFCVGKMFSAINFGERRSAIKVGDGATLDVLSASNMQITDGSLVKKASGANIRGQSISLSSGILDSAGAESLVTAIYDPTGANDTIQLTGNHSFDAEPGTVLQEITVSGNNNKIEGQPLFNNDPGITLQAASAYLTLAIQSKLNKNIALGGGVLRLDDDLRFADDIQLTGEGTVQLNGNQISFGGKDLGYTSTIYWDHASDMVLNAKVALSSTWTFEGESHIAGNGNILDLTQGGTLWIKHGSTLHLRDIKLRGLGSGSFVFEDKTSQVRFSDSQVEMDRNYTVTQGGIYVDGESTIYVKNWILNFDQNGSLTVDGTCLWYDLLDQESHVVDWYSIKPTKDNDLQQAHIAYLNDGVIRRIDGGGSSPIIWAGVNYLHEDLWLSPDHYAIVIDDKVVLGRSHSIHFSRTDDPIEHYTHPLIEVQDGKTLTLLNIVLENFSPNHISLGTDSSVSFSDKTTIELFGNTDLNETWTFVGDCIIRGMGHTLTLGENGNIVVQKSDVVHSSVLFDDITIEGISGNKIRCIDNTGTLSFNGVTWIQDENYSFTVGHIDIVGSMVMKGDSEVVFAYETNEESKIWQDSSLKLDTGFTFSYAPNDRSQRDLIQMADETAIIFMNGATLRSTKAGLRLTKGTLILDHKNLLYNQDSDGDPATDMSDAVAFGNSVPNILNIEIMPAGSIDVKTGILDINEEKI